MLLFTEVIFNATLFMAKKQKLHPVIVFLLGALAGAILITAVGRVSVPAENLEDNLLRNFAPNSTPEVSIIIPSAIKADNK